MQARLWCLSVTILATYGRHLVARTTAWLLTRAPENSDLRTTALLCPLISECRLHIHAHALCPWNFTLHARYACGYAVVTSFMDTLHSYGANKTSCFVHVYCVMCLLVSYFSVLDNMFLWYAVLCLLWFSFSEFWEDAATVFTVLCLFHTASIQSRELTVHGFSIIYCSSIIVVESRMTP